MNGTQFSELPSEITAADKTNGKSDNTMDSVSSKFKSGQSTELSSYSMPYDSTSGRSEEFHTLSPERNGKSPTENVSRLSGMTAEESLESIKKEFEKLEKPANKVKTYAVNRDGELISEHSDSDKSLRNSASLGGQEITQYTISSQGSGQDKTTSKLESFSGLSSYTVPETTVESRLTEFSNKSSFGSGSVSSNPKSSSFTNVTSDPSMNITNATNLSEYTLNDSEMAGENVSDNNNYVQQKFASLDNLISESKNIIAKHKQIISKNKNSEEDVPKLSSEVKSSAVPNVTSGLKSSEKQTVVEPPSKYSLIWYIDLRADH